MNIPIVTINGINKSAPGTVDRIRDVLNARGHDARSLTYPTRRWNDTRNRRTQYEDALRMLNQLPTQPVDVVAHSWGCMLACRMMELGGTGIFRRVFFFAPAIDKDWIFPVKAFEKLWVIHHEQDRAVWFAEHLFVASHPWGDMGRYGYAGTDARVVNVKDDTKRPTIFNRMHGHYFEAGHLGKWVGFIEGRVI